MRVAIHAHQHRRKVERKKRESVRAVFCGTGAARLRGGPSVRLPAVLPSDDELVANLVDGMPPLASFESRRCDSM